MNIDYLVTNVRSYMPKAEQLRASLRPAELGYLTLMAGCESQCGRIAVDNTGVIVVLAAYIAWKLLPSSSQGDTRPLPPEKDHNAGSKIFYQEWMRDRKEHY